MQGVTELVERERCKDEWWNQVVDEMRSGCLSEATWRYLHGYAVDGCALSGFVQFCFGFAPLSSAPWLVWKRTQLNLDLKNTQLDPRAAASAVMCECSEAPVLCSSLISGKLFRFLLSLRGDVLMSAPASSVETLPSSPPRD